MTVSLACTKRTYFGANRGDFQLFHPLIKSAAILLELQEVCGKDKRSFIEFECIQLNFNSTTV